ncbi:tetratricopeptide repeat protein [Schlesneria sp. T3-172]|uniref:tetratricopeptide repeat protein n=1 Tax=Schlesneria sphaerica TaxID=3373610 RepID=UPI0037C854A7
MRIVAITSVAMGFFLQCGCVSTLSPTATPSRLQAYHDQIAGQYVTANDMERQGDYEGARQIYLDLHEKHPRNSDYLHRLGVVSTKLERYTEAQSYYSQAQSLDPTNVRLLADMGYTFYLTKNLAEAEVVLREALRHSPNDPRSTNNLALVLGLNGKMNECMGLLSRVNTPAESLACMAYIHAERGQLELAEDRYTEALTLDPNLKNAAKALAELQKRNPSQNLVAQTLPDTALADDTPMNTPRRESSPIRQVNATQHIDMDVDLEPRRSQVVTADFHDDAAGLGEQNLRDARFELDEMEFSSGNSAAARPEELSEETSDWDAEQ